MFKLRSLDAEIDRLGACRLELRAGLVHIHFGHDTLIESVRRKLQCLLEPRDGLIKQAFLFVETAQFKIVQSKFRMRS